MSGMNLDYAPGWRPEEGDKVIGRITDIAMGRSNYGNRRYPIITVDDEENGPVAVHCFHAALYNRMMELRPKVGERIGVQFKGIEPHKTEPSQTVAQYVVRIDGRSADVFGALAAEAPAPRVESDVPADVSDFAPAPSADKPADDDIPF